MKRFKMTSTKITNIEDIDHDEDIKSTLSESKKPFFNDLGRENNKVYQKIRRENKSLKDLNKVCNKTKTNNQIFKDRLLNNPLFI